VARRQRFLDAKAQRRRLPDPIARRRQFLIPEAQRQWLHDLEAQRRWLPRGVMMAPQRRSHGSPSTPRACDILRSDALRASFDERWQIPKARWRFREWWAYFFVTLYTYFMQTSIGVYDIYFSSWLPFHILSVYDISIHILRKRLLILCIISLRLTQCVYWVPTILRHMYKIFTTRSFTQQNKNSRKR
jgi:hypothetical protein